MGTEYYRKSGQIPAFGDWENANEMPITQYFECARQAGLIRCSCSGQCGGAGAGVGYRKSLPRTVVYAVPQLKKSSVLAKRTLNPQSNQQGKQQVKVRELMNQPRNHSSGNLSQQKSSISAKPLDEDLYKISPELLRNSKRKNILGFFAKCIVAPCAAA